MRSLILVHWILGFLATPARTIDKTRLKMLMLGASVFQDRGENEHIFSEIYFGNFHEHITAVDHFGSLSIGLLTLKQSASF